ncbi:mycothiol synthase [Corynebacterium epidermidicanis]|nr:mycothiol synthase [Corynebacterium epidermidicanis]
MTQTPLTITQLHLPDARHLADKVQQLLADVQQHDGVAAFSEQFIHGLTDTRLAHQHFLAQLDGRIVGVLGLAADQAELAVTPAYRRRGVAHRLVAAASYGDGNLSLWAHGNLPPAQGFVSGFSAEKTRELLVMATKTRLPAVQPSADYQLLTLAEARNRWGKSADQELIRVNNEAFAWHPEQGGWDEERWARAQESSWFNPDDVLLLVRMGAETTPEVMGFHWVKWLEAQVTGKAAVGEVYVVGLADRGRRKGLGSALISAGLEVLWNHGAELVELYVEADNKSAISAYEKLGFAVVESHAVYTAPKSEWSVNSR